MRTTLKVFFTLARNANELSGCFLIIGLLESLSKESTYHGGIWVMSSAINKLVQLDIGDYSHWLSERGLSPVTRRGNIGRVRRFMTYLSSREDVLSAPIASPEVSETSQTADTADGIEFNSKLANVIDQFISELQVDCAPGPATINAYVTSISQLCKFCSLDAPTVLRLDYQPGPAQTLSADELQRYLTRVRLEPVRDQAAALILATSGIKLGQLTALNIEDVSKDAAGRVHLTVHRRGRKSLVVALGMNASEALSAWLDARPKFDETKSAGVKPGLMQADAMKPNNVENGNAVFIGRAGRLTTSAIDQVVRKIGLRAGLVVSSEMLRRTALTLSADNQWR
jgi:integrase